MSQQVGSGRLRKHHADDFVPREDGHTGRHGLEIDIGDGFGVFDAGDDDAAHHGGVAAQVESEARFQALLGTGGQDDEALVGLELLDLAERR